MADGLYSQNKVDSNTVTADLPEWYKQYTQNVSGTATRLAQDLNSQPLPAASVAGFNQDQLTGFDATRDARGNWKQDIVDARLLNSQIPGAYDAASDVAMAAARMPAQATAWSATPYANNAITAVGGPAGTTSGAIAPWAQSAQAAASQGPQSIADQVGAWSNNIVNSAGGPAQLNAADAENWANRIVGSAGNAAGQTAGNVQQYATNAGNAVAPGAQDWTSNYSKYMSPYTSDVVDNIARLGKRNWEDTIMPGINSSMIGAGQFGSTRNADILSKAGLSANQDILGQQANALQSGYTTGAGIFANDANRIQQQQQLQANTDLAGGNMMQGAYAADANRILQQQQNLTGAAQNAGSLYMNTAQADANRILQQQQNLTGATQNAGSLAYNALNSDAGRLQSQQQLQASTALSGGNLMQGALSSDAARAQQQQQLQSGAAISGGSLVQGAYAADANRAMQQQQLAANTALTAGAGNVNALNTASGNNEGLAKALQSMGITDVSQLQNQGALQQALQQRGYDTSFQNAQFARTDPWTQLSNTTGALSSLQLPKSQTTTNESAMSGSGGVPPTASDSWASGLTALAGILK